MKLTRLSIRPLVLLITIASLALAACSTPSQSAHVPLIGIVSYTTAFDTTINAFKSTMTDAGYVEGKSINYLYNGAVANDPNVIDQEIQKVLAQNPDMFLTVGSIVAYRIKDVLQKANKPGLFVPMTNPDKLGLVADLRKPGGKMTGINTAGPITGKGLEWLLIAAPDIKRVHVYYLDSDPTAPTQFPDLQTTADNMKVELVLHKIGSSQEAVDAIPSLAKGTDGVLFLAATIFTGTQQASFLEAAVAHGIPVGSTSFGGAPANQLAGLGVDTKILGKQAAQLAQQILHGADPGTLPVLASQFTRVINLVTAQSMGLTIPDSVLKQADNVVRTNPTPAATANASGGTPPATSSR